MYNAKCNPCSMSNEEKVTVMTVRGFIGVVHLPPMPGDPLHPRAQSFARVQRHALADAEALVAGGVDALILENFGSAPFPKGSEGQRTPPHQVAFMALLARQYHDRLEVPVGVNCLRNDAYSALGIAAAAGLHFIRVNVHTGAMVTDQGLIEGEAHRTLRYRQSLGSDVAILADVLVKHAAPLAPLDPAQATRECLERGLADGVIVSGTGTGCPVSRELLQQVSEAAGQSPVYIGSGLSPDNAADLCPLAHGAIVGTYLKREGMVEQPVEVSRVREMAAAVSGKFRAE